MSVRQPESPAPRATTNDSVRRLQIGIAGVFAVLLLVGLAGLIGDRAQKDAGVIAGSDTVIPANESNKGGEPLVELGVQPSAKPEAAVKAGPATQPLRPGSTVPDLQPDPELERARQSTK